MIIVMKPGAAAGDIDHIVSLLHEMGLKDHVIRGTDRTVVAAIGDKRLADKGRLENSPMVERIVPILAPYKMASREVRKERTVINVPNTRCSFGGKRLSVVAGPCSIESRDQILRTADAVLAAGATGLRGGAFKPRTNPYAFQGLGEEGLEMLAEAREKTGLAIVTEVLSESDVPLISQYADVLQIGARNMHNFRLLSRAGEQPKPVLLKRGFAATMEELLLAAEYIIAAGNPNVILCERGIRTSEDYVRNTLTLALVPAVQRESHLPIVIDPSHGTGHAYMVPSMSAAAVASGADGLIIEVHPDPEHAMTDGAQSLNCEAFATMMKQLRRVAEAVDREI